MSTLRFHLFGKFSVRRDADTVRGLEAGKAQELLSYLLIHRERPHPRETLASLMWGDTSTERSKKYLRQTLWHLQTALDEDGGSPGGVVLQVEHDWVRLNPQGAYWLDVAAFEDAAAAAQGVPGKRLDHARAVLLKQAVEFYQGDLLDGWYEDWCIFERERLQNIYLLILDKLISYSAAHSEYEAGQSYGYTILRYDRARERTHRQLMHLKYVAGDRTGALRQYARCAAALQEELGVKPERRTEILYEQIRTDSYSDTDLLSESANPTRLASLPELLGRLKRLHLVLGATQRRIQRDIKAVEVGLKSMKH